jgi:hypothetical protein
MSDFTIIIDRNKSTPEAKQTLGKLKLYKGLTSIFECFTLELPWKNNEPRISCIYTGEFECEKRVATAAIPYEHIIIKNVKGRSGICIHIANYYLQLLGCIAVGDGLIDMNKDGLMDVKNSGNTLRKLMSLLPNQFKLIIN